MGHLRIASQVVRSFAVLAETVHEVVSHALCSHSRLLLQHLLLLLDLSEPGVFQGLRSSNAVIRIVY
jgi:hypothetical protein